MGEFNESEYAAKLSQDIATIYKLQADLEKESVSDDYKFKLNEFFNRTSRALNYKLYKLTNKEAKNV